MAEQLGWGDFEGTLCPADHHEDVWGEHTGSAWRFSEDHPPRLEASSCVAGEATSCVAGPVPGATQAGARAKRKQVSQACEACKAAKKQCDEGRPCHRCMRLGIEDQVNPLPCCGRNVCDLRPLPPSA